jgi:hypothetical protein
MYTTSFAFFEAIAAAGVSYCFVNLGSDHPSLLEAMVTQKSSPKFPRIITCPSEVCPCPCLTRYPQHVLTRLERYI